MIAVVLLLLAALALIAWLLLRGVARDRGLPDGEIIYSDTERERITRALVSHRYRLAGKPDYIVRSKQGTYPVEVKPGRSGLRGPYDGDRAQVWAQCLLVEEHAGTTVRFGLLEYKDRKCTVLFGDKERSRMLAILAEMDRLEGAPDVGRNHNHVGKCRKCKYTPDVCGQSLV